jgi:hypothetical protein
MSALRGPCQRPLCVVCPVEPSAVGALGVEFARLRQTLPQKFATMRALHVARVVVLLSPLADGVDLIFECSFDGELEDFVNELWANAGEELGALFSRCATGPQTPNFAQFRAFLERQQRRVTAAFSAYPRLSVSAIEHARELDRRLQAELDRAPAAPSSSAEALFERLAARVGPNHASAPSAEPCVELRGEAASALAWARVLGWALKRLIWLAPSCFDAPPAPLARAAPLTLVFCGYSSHFKSFLLRRLTRWLRRSPGALGSWARSAHWLELPGPRLVCFATYESAFESLPNTLRGTRGRHSVQRWLGASRLTDEIGYGALSGLSVAEIRRNRRLQALLEEPRDGQRAPEFCGLL